MADFANELERFKTLVESTESFQLQLDLVEVRRMARRLYATMGPDSARVVDQLSFEDPPFVNLIDRRHKDVEDRSAVWKAFSDVYLGRLVAVNVPNSDSGHDYTSYVARLSADAHSNILSTPLPTTDRPVLTPSLGTITIWVTYVVWDDISIAFSVEYDGSLHGIGDHIIEVAGARERNLHILVGTHDRDRPTHEVGQDLIRRWRAEDNSQGEIQKLKLGFRTHLTGDIRPILPSECTFQA